MLVLKKQEMLSDSKKPLELNIKNKLNEFINNKNVAHGTGGDKNVLVQARFLTTGSGTPGKSVASFEASNATSCGSSCNNTEKNTFKDSVVRYSATATTKASKYTEELPK